MKKDLIVTAIYIGVTLGIIGLVNLSSLVYNKTLEKI